eukprot:1143102-Ditylum_brightwellii.AAC.1
MILSPGGKQCSSYNKNCCLECNKKKKNKKNNKDKKADYHAFANETMQKPSLPHNDCHHKKAPNGKSNKECVL